MPTLQPIFKLPMLEEFIRKPINEWTSDDVRALVEQGAREDDRLEFKSEMYGPTDEPTREMLRDVASLANHQGGYLVIGVEEEAEGIATSIVGVPPSNHDERLRASIRSNITPRINGLEVVCVPIGAGSELVVVHVPYSYTRPHMITFRGLNQFWKRHGREKNPMTIDEIQYAFERRLDGLWKVETHVTAQKKRAEQLSASAPSLFLYATPICVPEELVNIQDQRVRLMMHSRAAVGAAYVGVRNQMGPPRPTLHGLVSEDSTYGLSRWLAVHRSGHVEFFSQWDWRDMQTSDVRLNPTVLAGTIVDFFLLVGDLYSHLGAVIPMLCGAVIFSPTGIDYFDPRRRSPTLIGRWPDQILDVPTRYSEDIEQQRWTVAEDVCRRIWNAFSQESCPYVTGGQFVV